MKIADCRKQGKTIPFRGFAIGSVFEHPLNKKIFMKIDLALRLQDDTPFIRNAIELETGDLWTFKEDFLVHPLEAKLVIDDD